MEAENGLEQALESWRQGRASLEQVRSLAADLGNQHYAQGIPELIELLKHDDEIVRYNAVNSLAFEFHHKPVADQLLAMLTGDPDDDCRRVAAGALGSLFQSSRDHRILAALGQAALNDPERYVRSSAYKSLQIVNGVSRDEHLELLRSQNLSVDPAHVNAILAELSV